METWRLITTWGADPAFNMGLDEALLANADAPTTLRLYTWKPDTLSLGYFQRVADVPGAERVPALVRRITGGGAIHHKNELTFSIAAPLSHPLYRGNVGESYVRVHDAIRAALRELGIESALRGARALASDCLGTGMCFHKSTDLDIVWNERKGVGSAQRRRASRVLHHGSIKLGTTPLEGEIATIQAFAPDAAVHDVALLLRASFEKSFGVAFETSVPDADERTQARELGKRYVSREFVQRR
jgi:lipoate-protein ligase A